MDSQEESNIIPVIPSGKYQGKLITEVLNDTNYFKWLEQQPWFSKSGAWRPVYNIIVNNKISSNKDEPTPEHNKLQNMFMEENNRIKLVKCVFNNGKYYDRFFEYFKFKNYYHKITKDYNLTFESKNYEFEGIFNWDLIVYYTYEYSDIILPSTEFNMKIVQDEKELRKEHFRQSLILFDEIIDTVRKEEEETIKEYKIKNEIFNQEIENYPEKIKIYKEEKNNYENSIRIYKNKQENKKYNDLNRHINECLKINCNDMGFEYKDFNMIRKSKSNKEIFIVDANTFYKKNEAKILQKLIDKDIQSYLDIHGEIIKEKEPKEPTKPPLPEEPKELIKDCDGNICVDCDEKDNILKEKIKYSYKTIIINDIITGLYNRNYSNHHIITKRKKEFEEEELKIINNEKNLENSIINEYGKKIESELKSMGYEGEMGPMDFSTTIYGSYSKNMVICCEIKPIIGDDYPCILRKMKAQIKLSKTSKKFEDKIPRYVLFVKDFNSEETTKEQFVEIFRKSNINVIFKEQLDNMLLPCTDVKKSEEK